MNKQQLASRIWAAANKMRSKIDANEYKDYFLGFIFYKFLSDGVEKKLRADGWDDDDIKSDLNEAHPKCVAYLKLIIDKCHSQPEKALFNVRRTIQNRWRHDVLRNWLSTDLYEREGNKVSPCGIFGCDVLCLSMADTAPFFFCGQINGKVFY